MSYVAGNSSVTSENFVPVAAFQYDRNCGVSSQMITALHNDGVVCLRNSFDRSWLDLIEQGIESALGGASTDVDIVKRDGDAGSFSFSSGAWQTVAPFHRFIFDSHLADIAWSLLDTTELVLFYDFLLVKQARSDSAGTPWHQDHSYYPLDGHKAINCWVALDDIPLSSALRFIRGSHSSGQLYRAVDFDDPKSDYRYARKELVLPPVSELMQAEDIMACGMKAGDMLVWTSHTLHSAPGNTLNHRRAAFSVNWLGDDIVFNGKPSLATYSDPSQVVGKSIACSKFPKIRG